MRGLIGRTGALAAAALLAAGALTGCATSAGGGTGQGGGQSAGIPAAVSDYCEATTPTLRALLRVPLLALLDLPADTGELLCVATDAGMAVIVEGDALQEAPAAANEPSGIELLHDQRSDAAPPLIVAPALTPGRFVEA